jgi:hypothetical protein
MFVIMYLILMQHQHLFFTLMILNPETQTKHLKEVLFGITQVRGRLGFILNFHQSPLMTHQMLRRDFGRCEVISGSAKYFEVLQSILTILLGEGKVDK